MPKYYFLILKQPKMSILQKLAKIFQDEQKLANTPNNTHILCEKKNLYVMGHI